MEIDKRIRQVKKKKTRKRLILTAAALVLVVSVACFILWAMKNEVPPDDSLYVGQNNLSAVGIESAWKAGLTGKGVNIAVIDTGVEEHEDLKPRRVTALSYLEDDEDTGDSHGHGTFVTGLLAAERNNGRGIAGMTDSHIVSMKIMGTEGGVSIDSMCRAIRDAVDEYDCRVINISMGTPNYSEELEEAVEYAISKNAIVVAAAGGDGETPYYPAAYEGVIGVNMVNNELDLTDYSVKNESVFVAAPGENLISLSILGGYERSGTGSSYAAAHVTAMAAMAKQADPEMTVPDFRELLKTTSKDMGDEGYDTSYGWGVIDFPAFAKEVTK